MVAPAIAAALIGGAFGFGGQLMQNVENRAATAQQMAFQERMSNTQYQRGMKDMQKAGLNPILAYQQGGAGTPSGSTYQAGNVGAAALEGASSALATQRAERMQDLEYDRLGADVDIANQTARNLIDQRRLIQAQTVASGAQAARESATTAILREDLQSAKAAAAAARTDEEFYETDAGKFLRNVERISRSILPGAQTARQVGSTR